MCDYSLQSMKSRPAIVGEVLVTKNFGTGTSGFASCTEGEYDTAVCLLPGTELAFEADIACGFYSESTRERPFRTAIFRQVEKNTERVHHDALELPDGETMKLTYLVEGQRATVLQLPVNPEQRIPYNEGQSAQLATA